MPPELSSGDGTKDYLNEKKNDRDRKGTEKINFSRGRGRGDSYSVIEGAAGLETHHTAATSISSKHNSSGLSWPHAASRQERHSFFLEDASYGSMLSPPTDAPVQEKMYEDENLGFHVEGRNSKNSREHMESSFGCRYVQTDQKLQHWDTRDTSLFSTGRRNILSGKSVDHISLHASHLHSDSESSWDQVQSKEQSRKTGVEYSSMDHTIDAQRRASGNDVGRLSENDFETRLDRYGSFSSYYSHVGESHNHLEDNLGSSVEWKPLKWARSGNLSSCSTVFGRSGSFKEPRGEMHNHHDIHGKLSAHHSTSRLSDAGIYVVPDDETHLQKKQRLGWGQGLAKYEKQKVEGQEDETNKSDLTQCEILLSPKVEEVGCALQTNLYIRSPKLTSSSGCGSPATPYSVICISSPDEHVSSSIVGSNEVFIEEKSCIKASDFISPELNDADGIFDLQSALPITRSDSVLGESSLESDHLELNPITAITSMAIDALHTEDTTLGISGSRSVADVSAKIDLLQKLEKIECEIEKYEKELKLLNLETSTEDHHFLRTNYLEAGRDCSLEACTEESDKGPGDRCSNALDGGRRASSTMPVLNDGFTAPSVDSKENGLNQTCLSSELQFTEYPVLISEGNTTDAKVVRSQWSEESFMDVPSMDFQLVRTENRLVDTLAVRSQSSGGLEHNVDEFVTVGTCNEPLESKLISSEEPRTTACFEVNEEVACQSISITESRNSVSSILAANKEVAKEASELVGKLLPTVLSETSGVLFSDILDSSLWKQNTVLYERNRKQMEAKISDRRHFMNFKERALALKFRVHRQLWKEDQLLMPARRHQARTQKHSETDCILSGGHKKNRSSVRSRFASPAGNLTSAPTEEAIRLARKLLSNAKGKSYKSILKMPALALDEGEKCFSRFITSNGLVGDPISFEKERTMVNPWMPEEKRIFLEKFAAFGKNFSKIASFLEHKTTADCVEFFYKNQKSEDFMKIKEMHKLHNKRDNLCESTYLTTSGNNQPRQSNAASLDKAASKQAVGIWHTLQKYAGRPLMGMRFDHGRCTSQFFMDTANRRTINSDLDSESATAVDVLAGICGAFSCEPVGSCVTTTGVDRSESHQEKGLLSQHRKKNADTDHTLTSEAVENIEIQYSSEENCGEINLDWTDDEKALFISAVAMFGKDFGRICHYVHSRTEVQCKTFFSKARKRLGLDELIPRESDISVKRNHGREDDETGLDKICALLWDTDTSANVGEIPYVNAFSEVGPNSNAGIVLDDFCDDHHRSEVENIQKKSNSGEGKASLKEQTELKESAIPLQNSTETTSGKAPASPEAQDFSFNRSLMNRRGGLHVCSLTDTQQNDNPKVLDTDALCPDESRKSQVIVESYDKARDFVGNNVEAEDHKPCEAVISCSGKNSFVNDLERCHGMVKREVFIDSKGESEKHEKVGSLMEPISSEEDSRLPGNKMKEKCPVNVTSQGSRSAGTLRLPTSVPNENSLYHCFSSNSGILSSDRLVNPTTDGSKAALHASDDVSSTEKCLIGSRLTGIGNDPFGMNVLSATINSKSLVGGKSAGSGASSTNNAAWKLYLDGKESVPLPVHGQERIPICTSVVSRFQQKPSDSFSYIPQQMIDHMGPEVVSHQNQHIPSFVLPKGHNMFQQASASSLLVRKRHLENPMVHHYQIEEECHKIQEQGFESELPSQKFRGQLQMLTQTEAHSRNVGIYQQETLPLDSEQSSSWQFGGQQLQMLNHRQAYAHRNVDAYKQEAFQQSASDSKLSSQVLAGQQLLVIGQEEICRRKKGDTYQQAALQHLAQEHYNSQVKSLQQNQIIQPNSQQHLIQKVQNAKEEHQSPVSQILQMSNSEQTMELSNQIKQSSLIPEQYQHLHQWQQKCKAHNDICEDYRFPKKTEWPIESHQHLQSQRFENNFNPITNSIYSSQVSSLPGEIEVKSCPTPEEQTPRRGDVKLFGQNLLSHPSNVSKPPPSNKDISESIESLQGSQKTFSIQENDEWCLAMATMSSEKQSQTCHSCVHSEDIAASAENTKSGMAQEAVAHIIEHFACEAQESQQNLAKVDAGYLGQDFGGKNFQSWEGSGGHNPCINSMPVQTGTLSLPQDLNLQFKGNSLLGTSVDQPVKAGSRCKEISINSSAIPGVHGRVIQDVPYPIRDPLTIRHSDYHPAGHRDLGSSSFTSLDLKLPECSVEFQKRNGVVDVTMPSGKPGRYDTVQSMFAFQSQIRNVFNDTGFQMDGIRMPGGTVSDPVSAINMLDSAAEQATVSLKYPQFTSTEDLVSERGDSRR